MHPSSVKELLRVSSKLTEDEVPYFCNPVKAVSFCLCVKKESRRLKLIKTNNLCYHSAVSENFLFEIKGLKGNDTI